MSTPLLACPPLRWGILGGGRIANDFAQALKILPSQHVAAIATRSPSTAATFASTHSIPTHYGSYDQLLDDPNVDIIYVANVHKFRLPVGTSVLNKNKHVLLEKPFALNLADATKYPELKVAHARPTVARDVRGCF